MPISTLRYSKHENLREVREMYRDYFREIIDIHGLDLVYFRKQHDFHNNVRSEDTNHIYGEETTNNFYLNIDMVMYLKIDGENLLLNKFGLETDGDATAYIVIKDFNELTRNSIGTDKVHNIVDNIQTSVEICDWVGEYQHDITVFEDEFFGFVGTDLDLTGDMTEGVKTGSIVLNFQKQPYNQYIRTSPTLDTSTVTGSATVDYVATLDADGNGTVDYTLNGSFTYKGADTVADAGRDWNFAPNVGDFIRIPFHMDSNQFDEYDITKVTERNLSETGINPHLDKYIYEMRLVRRDPSYEDVDNSASIGGTAQEEAWTAPRLEQNEWAEIESDETFDYDNTVIDKHDKADSDSVYGDY